MPDVSPRLVFLGSAFNPLSVSALSALVASGYRPLVGIEDAASRGLWTVTTTTVRTRGVRFVLLRAGDWLRGRVRIALRRLGCRVSGAASLYELGALERLESVPCLDPNAAAFVARIRDFCPELIVVAAFGRRLRAEILSVPRLGCLNVHPSLLPRYRGPNPFYWVLANREHTTGVTLHFMDERLDAGPIVLTQPIDIRPGETERGLRSKCCALTAELLARGVPMVLEGTAPRQAQDEAWATYWGPPPKGASAL